MTPIYQVEGKPFEDGFRHLILDIGVVIKEAFRSSPQHYVQIPFTTLCADRETEV